MGKSSTLRLLFLTGTKFSEMTDLAGIDFSDLDSALVIVTLFRLTTITYLFVIGGYFFLAKIG